MTATPDVVATNTNAAAPDLGVLFVHGIGHQITGETVVQFGDPLLRWLDEWLRFSPELSTDQVAKLAGKKADKLTRDDFKIAAKAVAEEFLRSKHRPSVTEARIRVEGEVPAHTHVEIPVASDNSEVPKRWILAEFCWSNAFVPPTFKALAFWGLVIYPWTNATHYGSRIRRKWSRARGREGPLLRALAIVGALIGIAFLVIGSVLVSIIVLLLLTLVLVLAIPPIPSLRAMLLRVQQALADTLGDCFILVASPVQKGAIVSHVRRDIDWLVSRGCKNIAVVAHSQGAAVAFEALSTGVFRKSCQAKGVESDSSAREVRKSLLITFGSGLAKLRELENALVTEKAKFGWIPIAGLALLVLSLEFCNVINLIPFLGSSLYWTVWCGFLGILFWIGGVLSSIGERPKPNDFKFESDTAWRDYYASHDPVPNGPLFEEDQTFLKGAEVHNFASLWRDHTTYWQNRDEFVPAIMRDLAELSQLPLFDLRAGDNKKIEAAAKRRAARVQWLAYARSAIWVATVTVIITRWIDLPRFGGVLLSQLPLLEKILGWFGIKQISNGEIARTFLAEELAGIVAVLVCGALAYQLVRLIWQIWTWRDTRALLQRESDGSEWVRWLFLLVTLGVVNAGIVISLGLPGTRVARPFNPMPWVVYLMLPGLASAEIMFVWRLIRHAFAYKTFFRTWPAMNVRIFWPAPIVTLLLVPILALSLVVEMGDLYRKGIVAGLIALGCLLIHYFGILIEAERQTNV
jgi:hypothetical protein